MLTILSLTPARDVEEPGDSLVGICSAQEIEKGLQGRGSTHAGLGFRSTSFRFKTRFLQRSCQPPSYLRKEPHDLTVTGKPKGGLLRPKYVVTESMVGPS